MEFEIKLSTFLSILKLILAPFILIFLIIGYNIPAITLFIIAILSIILNYYLSKEKSKLESAIDILANKLLIILTSIAITIKFSFPIWALIIFLAKDIALIIGSVMIYEAIKEFKVLNISIITFWFQIATIFSYIIDFRFKNFFLLIAVILAIISFIHIIRKK